MLTPGLREVSQAALERLAAGASLADVLGMIVTAAEASPEAVCSVLSSQDGLRISSGDIPAIDLRTAEDFEGRGVVKLSGAPFVVALCEPIIGHGGAVLGKFCLFERHEIDFDEEERGFVHFCAHLAGLAIERKRAERRLIEREQELSSLVETIIEGVVTIDDKGVVETMNRAAVAMFGYPREEVLGQNVNMLMPSPDREQHDSYIDNYVTTSEPKVIGVGREVQGQRKDGTLFPLELGVSEHWISGRRKFTGILRDITERRENEEALRRSQKLEAVGTLAAGIAHDFNNLLMGIKGCTSMAIGKLPSDSDARRFLEESNAAAERGTELTRQLLAFSRQSPSQIRPMNLNEVLRRTDVMLRRLLGSSVNLQIQESNKECSIEGDPNQLEHVLLNLVVNARDALGDKGKIVVVTRAEERPSGERVILEVQDDGVGMDRATQARIFEPFFTTKDPDRGTGLGLSSAYGIVSEHGGDIEVQSAPGEGTTIRVVLPALQT